MSKTPSIDPNEAPYWVAWSRLSGISSRHLPRLAEHFGSLGAAWHAPPGEFARVLDDREITGALERRKHLDPARCWQDVQRSGQRVLCWPDADFPAALRTIHDAPAVLYVRGSLPRDEHAIAIVGTRKPSLYGSRVAKQLGRSLASVGAVVVSGAAAGVDARAHEGALEAPGGVTVAVLGHGLDHIFPAGHARLFAAIAARGALVTEHPPDERPAKWTFPRRNRLIAGLAKGVVVVEAGEKSGSLITAKFANEEGREVFAVPGPIDAPGSAGPHALLRDGARLVASAADVLDELGWEVRPARAPEPADALERLVLAALADGSKGLDALAARCRMDVGRLTATLLTLELQGLVTREPGGRYAARP